MEKRDFFVSYSKADEGAALWVANTLKRHSYTVYLQAWDSGRAENFLEWINDAINASCGFIEIWSQSYSNSAFCKLEESAAMNARCKGRMEIFLPVRAEDYPLKPLYQHINYVNLFDNEKAEADLLKRIQHPDSPELPIQQTYAVPSSERITTIVTKKLLLHGIRRGTGDFRENTVEKLRRAMGISEEKQILLAHDETILRNGKNGFVITDAGIYCAPWKMTPYFVSWEHFISHDVIYSAELSTVYVYLDDQTIISYLAYLTVAKNKQMLKQMGDFWKDLQETFRNETSSIIC